MRNDYDAHEALVRAATLERWYAYRVDHTGATKEIKIVDRLDALSLPRNWRIGRKCQVMR